MTLALDPLTRELIWPDGRCRLSRAQGVIVTTLTEQRGQSVSRDDLRMAIWPNAAREPIWYRRAINVQMARLRLKLLAAKAPITVLTKFRVGYVCNTRVVVLQSRLDA